MKSKKWLPGLIIFVIIGCQMFTPTATPTVEKPAATNTSIPEPSPTPTEKKIARPVSEPVNFTPMSWQDNALSPLSVFQSNGLVNQSLPLPIMLNAIANSAVISGLTVDQQVFLAQNGFVVMNSQEEQFKDIRRSVAFEQGQPYFLTSDAVYHAVHITFDDLLEALEKEALRPVMIQLLETLYNQVDGYYQASAGSSIASDALLAKNYLAVALKLFNPDFSLPPAVEADIASQLDQISAEAGKDESSLIPGLTDDYSAYRPVGHYTGSPELEAYFQGMTWLGRVAFSLRSLKSDSPPPSRAPLLINLALREAKMDGVPAYQVWLPINEILDFIVGPSDDPGPMELNTLMEAVYGSDIYLELVQDNELWQTFLTRVEELPAPQINSTFQDTSLQMDYERDWRFMGQRFTLDGLIFQQLITDKVEKRFFPKGLDLAAAYGSSAAENDLKLSGEMQYKNYKQQLDKMKQFVSDLPDEFWTNRFYTAWQYAFMSQVQPKDKAFPGFMQTSAWSYKDINSMLASWAELKHDTILYAKMPEGLGGGGPPTSAPPPSFVEPNPNVYYRLAFALRSLSDGINLRLYNWYNHNWIQSEYSGQPGLQEYLTFLGGLGEKIENLGTIADKELRGQSLTVDDYDRITSCLEFKECIDPKGFMDASMQPDPIPVIAAVSGYENEIMEAGVGYLNRIYVTIPINGEIYVAQGGVLSYYEFIQPREDRLTDEAWREKLEQVPPEPPEWTVNFLLPGGKINTDMVYRIGDFYFVTAEGGNPPLNLRAEPSRNAQVVDKLVADTYFEITAGPETVAKENWWQIRVFDTGKEGWVLENQAWYQRSY